MRSALSDRGALLADFGLSQGAALSGKPKRARIDTLGRRRWPSAGATLDLDFVNQQGYVFGRGIASIGDLVTFSGGANGTRVNNAGLIVPAAAPRFDYDPVTLSCKGLLAEEQRTNLLVRSQEFDNATWSKANNTITANASIGPDGVLSMDKTTPAAGITMGTGNAQTRISSAVISKTAGTSYALTLYAKAGEFDSFFIGWIDTAGNSTFSYNLGTGAASTVSGPGAPSMVAVGNGFYRGNAALTQVTTESQNIRFSAKDSVATVGDGASGISIWQADLQAGAFATSPIPTVASQVTRTADVAVMTGTNFSSWYNQAAFTLVIKFKGQASGTKSYFSISDGTVNARIELQSVGGTLTLNVIDGGVAQAALALGSVVTGTDYTVAIAWALNDFAASVNGAALVTDGAGTLPTPDRLHIGMDYAAANVACTTIARVNGYPSRLSNAQLQALAV